MKINEYLKMSDAADFLGVTRRSLYNWIDSGQITSYRDPISGHRMFKQEDLQAILDNIKQEPTNEVSS